MNHILYMHDLKLYAKSMSELDSLIQSIRSFSQDTGMDFAINKRAVVEQKRGKLLIVKE